MNANFIRERLTKLRLKRGVSEYQMSLELGQSKSYIQGITSGKSLPSIIMLLKICEYLEVTPVEFFDTDTKNPYVIQKALDVLKQVDEDDIELLFPIMKRMIDKTDEK